MDARQLERVLGEAQRLVAEGRVDEALPLALTVAQFAPVVWAHERAKLAAVANTVAEIHRRMGNFDEAEPRYLEALQITAEVFGTRSEAHAVVTTNFALSLHERGDAARAAPVVERAVGLLIAVHGQSHPAVENGLRLLAAVRGALGDDRGELAASAGALMSEIQRVGSTGPDVMALTNELAVRASRMGHFEAAERLAEIYLEAARVVMPDSLDLAVALENLAFVYTQRGRMADTAQLYGEALELRRSVQGDEHADVTVALERRAESLRAAGDVEGAIPLLAELVDRRRSAGDDAELARSLNNLGTAHFTLRNLTDAERCFADALALARRGGDDTHPNVARALQSLATVYLFVGEYGRAEVQLVEAVTILRAAGPSVATETATALVNLGGLYLSTDRPAAAEASMREALELRRMALGSADRSTLDVEARLAGVLERTGDVAGAIATISHVCGVADATFGIGHQIAFDHRRQLTRLLQVTGDHAAARASLHSELEALGTDRRVLLVLQQLSVVEQDAGDLAAAFRHARDAVDLLRAHDASLGPLADGLERLADLGEALGDHDAAVGWREEAVALRRRFQPHEPTSRALATSIGALAEAYAASGRSAEATPLLREAVLLHDAEGRSAEAVPLARRLVDLLRDDRADADRAEPMSLGIALNLLAEMLRRSGDPVAAIALYEEALGIDDRLGSDDPTLTGALWSNLGMARAAIGDHAHAREAYDHALSTFRSLPGPTEGLAFALNNLSQTLDALGEHDAADRLLDESLAVRREVHGADSAQYATALLNRGLLLVERGHLVPAESALREALTTFLRHRGDGHPDTVVALNGLGYLHRRLGRYEDAEKLLRLALSVQSTQLQPDDPRLGPTLMNLAGVLQLRGDVANADVMFRRALDITTVHSGPDHDETGAVLNNYAQLLLELGRLAEADQLLERALEIAEATGDDFSTATVANNLGLLRLRTGHRDALQLLERALEIRRRLLGDDHVDVAQALNNVAAAVTSSDPERARTLLERALDVRRRLLGPDHPDVAESANNLSFVCGDTSRATALLEEAARIRRTTNDGPQLADTLTSLAFNYVLLGQPDRALPLYREAADVRDHVIARVAGLATERDRLGFLTSIRADLALFLTTVRVHLADRPDAIRLACDLVLRRKAVVTDGIAAQRAAVLGGRYATLRDDLRELDAIRGEIAARALTGPAPSRDALDDLGRLEQRMNALELALARQIPELDTTRRVRAADTTAVAAALPTGSALIEFVRVTVDPAATTSADDAAWYAAFVVPAGDPDATQMVDLGSAGPIDDLIGELRSAITGRVDAGAGRDLGAPVQAPDTGDRAVERVAVAGAALSRMVLGPLLDHLGTRRRLLVVVDGEISRLPLEVLPLGDGRLVIDEYTVSYLSAGRDILRIGRPTGTPRSPPLVVADPDYDLVGDSAPAVEASASDRRAWFFTRLTGTRREGHRVASLLGAEPVLGADAVEMTIKSVEGPSVLHVATHGFFQPDPVDPARPEQVSDTFVRTGLALAGANAAWFGARPPADAEDGILTAEDVAGLDLYGTSLVVLSACETGLGRVHVGEGVFGLRRAVALAGAETLVMSLWKVPDQESCELMEAFYARLLAGDDRAAALRHAQLSIKERLPHPFFWGAFICEGAFGPTPLGEQS